jgi:hypothetical protein
MSFTSSRFLRKANTWAIFALSLGCASRVAAQNCISITPTSLSINFQSHAVGTTTTSQQVIVTNNCTSNVTIQSFSLSPLEFPLVAGWAPANLTPGHMMRYEIRFAPDAAQTFNGQLTVDIQGQSPVVVALTGIGYITQAAASLSATSLNFSNIPVGSTSASQNVTLTNSGTGKMAVLSVYTDPPFIVEGFSGNTTTLPQGAELPLQVAFSPSLAGSYTGTLVIVTDQLPPKGVTLSATAVAAKSFSISNFRTLPVATQGAAYQATLNEAGGVGGVTWSLASGSSLPAGLTLSTLGTISGTVGANLKLGTYHFIVTASDSNSPPDNASAEFALTVAAPTGASCNNIFWDVAGTGTPIVPMVDLGTGYYLGAEGGLYGNGSNTMPASHDADGVSFAQAIQPLDANGNPDANGKYALLSVGMSVAFDTYLQVVQDATAEPTINSHLVFVPGAQPGVGTLRFANPNDPAWAAIMDYFLPQSGVTANQVVAAWVMDTDSYIQGTFPGDMAAMQSEYESIAQNLHTKFPNLKLAFFSSRDYSGYSNGMPNPQNPEPYAYESAYAVRGMIEDQLNGVPAMNYNPANGPVMAPWVAWADYNWANGLLARSDGLVWTCQDFLFDGTHNSNPAGREKDANLVLSFFRTNDATVPWFLAAPSLLKTQAQQKAGKPRPKKLSGKK